MQWVYVVNLSLLQRDSLAGVGIDDPSASNFAVVGSWLERHVVQLGGQNPEAGVAPRVRLGIIPGKPEAAGFTFLAAALVPSDSGNILNHSDFRDQLTELLHAGGRSGGSGVSGGVVMKQRPARGDAHRHSDSTE
ncbi:hypothetical protein [Mycobacterium sp. 1245111.1]|uniref:hypothetical protein n=1 Tax=Mycobacterium sp. 1245111.1 TaxID=1834073 RepID=UPI001E499F43|nr:hypothetical protein [Mycobacterium sp. 1245111.1]